MAERQDDLDADLESALRRQAERLHRWAQKRDGRWVERKPPNG